MKLTGLVLSTLCATQVFAATPKICFYAGGLYGNGSKGDRVSAQISEKEVEVKNLTSNSTGWEGKFAASGRHVAGKDGNTYIDYNAGFGDGCNTVLVDQKLLQPHTVGYLKFRCRGEGFSDTVYFCRDNK